MMAGMAISLSTLTAQRNREERDCHENGSDMNNPGKLSHKRPFGFSAGTTVRCATDGTNPAPGITLRNADQQSDLPESNVTASV